MDPQLPPADSVRSDPFESLFEELVHRLLGEAKEKNTERRAEKRDPFFKAIRLSFVGENRQFTCFSRDISPSGIGLLHYLTVEPGRVVLTVPSDACGDIRILAEIVWCRPCGEGWYVSGARFLQILPSQGKDAGRPS